MPCGASSTATPALERLPRVVAQVEGRIDGAIERVDELAGDRSRP